MTTIDLATWTAREFPSRSVIEGRTVRLEPVSAERHAEALFEAAHGEGRDPGLWDYLAYGPFGDVAQMRTWLVDRAASEDPLFYAVVDVASGLAVGMVSYLRIDPRLA